MAFKGFTPGTIAFLNDLAVNNNKEWFEANRSIYEEHVLQPMRDLTSDLGICIKSIDPVIDITPAVNKTISRIYRDTRFSKDKTPLRTDLWISFRRPHRDWGNVPEFYFYFTPEDYQFGTGFYCASAANMAKIREHIDVRPERFQKIVDFYNGQKFLNLGGEEYKRKIPNSLPGAFQKWYQKKNLFVNTSRQLDDVFFSAILRNDLENAFNQHAELYQFITECIYS
jgi:uncharacterized protein (TIGR02453 family)